VARLVVATTNRGKLREIAEILAGVPVDLDTLEDFPPLAVPDEPGPAFADNARVKARYYAAATGELTVAEDSGLEIDALGGAPGVESARYGGVDLPYPEKFALIERGLLERRAVDRTARFVCALALARGESILYEARGVVEGVIVAEARGAGGFGYDPIFFYPPFGCTLAEAAGRKSEVSHRGQAFRQLKEFLITGS
jgi:XTP/dITP diphosphohydrolase